MTCSVRVQVDAVAMLDFTVTTTPCRALLIREVKPSNFQELPSTNHERSSAIHFKWYGTPLLGLLSQPLNAVQRLIPTDWCKNIPKHDLGLLDTP